MAKGHDQHYERLSQVAMLGKELARRAKSKCELCEGSEGKLTPFEVEPLPEEPTAESAVLLCSLCRDNIERGEYDHNRWRFLESSIWSDTPPVQVTAVRACKSLSENGAGWAQDLLETVYLSPKVEEWLQK